MQPKHQHSSRVQILVKHFKYPILELIIKVNNHIAAEYYIEFHKKRIGTTHQIVTAKADLLTEKIVHADLVTLLTMVKYLE